MIETRQVYDFDEKKLKVCSRCKTNRPLSDFAKNNRVAGGKNYVCKPCVNAAGKYRRENFVRGGRR